MAIKYRAFTLAEVLITLGVIGIVAAMTLPTVVNKYKKKETVTRLKKAYSVINQAIIRSEADNGAMRYWFISNPVEQEDGVMYGKIALDYIVPYFQVDINGRKGPNVFGKDIFYFMISNKNKLAGYNYYGWNREQILENSCNKVSSSQNRECTALIMMDVWEIKDDYPW